MQMRSFLPAIRKSAWAIALALAFLLGTLLAETPHVSRFGPGGGAWIEPLSAATLLETTAGTTVLSYQGRIANPATNVAYPDGAFGVNFSLFDAPSGGTQLWTEARSVEQQRGIVTVLLGEVTALPLAIFDGRDLYLQLQVNGETLAPRQRLAWVAYAINARKAESVNDNTITSAKIVDGQVTAADIGDGQVTSAKIADGTIATADLGDGQVTSAKIADGTIGLADLSPLAQGKFINLDVYAALLEYGISSAAQPFFTGGFGPNAGITIPEASNGAGSFALNFVLPPDYTQGTPLTGAIVWHATTGGCNLFFAPNSISVARPGSSHIVGSQATTGLSISSTVLATGSANVSQSLPFTIVSPVPSNPLRAGDAIFFSFFRASTFPEDTCGGTTAMRIQGVSIAYQ